MKFEELKEILRTKSEFRRLEDWKFTRITSGGTSPNKFRLRTGKKDYYVKEISEQEHKILPVLLAIKSRLIPPVAYPDLLAKDILVSPYLGRCVRPGGRLEPRLFREFAVMQNTLNNPAVRRKLKRSHGYQWNDRDDGYFSRGVTKPLAESRRLLRRLTRRYGWRILDAWRTAFDLMAGQERALAREFGGMPFGRQHHDLREDNIVGKPQRLADWGSSYGHGPFIYDVAPYLPGDPRLREAFVRTSDICRRADPRTIDRWIWLATCRKLSGKVLQGLNGSNERMWGAGEGIHRHLVRFSWLCRIVLAGDGRAVWT